MYSQNGEVVDAEESAWSKSEPPPTWTDRAHELCKFPYRFMMVIQGERATADQEL